MNHSPFSKPHYAVHNIELHPFSSETAREMAASIALIDPWARLEISAKTLAVFLTRKEPCSNRFMIERQGKACGAISLRNPWLFGPYIELLAVLPDTQGMGIGRSLLLWVEQQARQSGHANIWVAASSFNKEALNFYEKNGFRQIGSLQDLVRNGFEEILLRKKIDVEKT